VVLHEETGILESRFKSRQSQINSAAVSSNKKKFQVYSKSIILILIPIEVYNLE